MTPYDNEIPIAARTDVGQRRAHNEDAVVAELPLLAVADGVGGSAKGEVASQLALDTLVQHVASVANARAELDASAAVEQAVLAANHAVHEAQLRDESLRGMATTLTAAVIRDGGEITVGHVGDSRLYVLSAAGARLVTDDHSVVAELVRTGRLDAADAAHHPQRNVITRALGPDRDLSVDAFTMHVGPGDWLLACSDGLTEHVLESELASIVVGSDPETALERLVALANERGGTDNITVAIAQPVPSDVSGEISIEALEAAAATTSQMRTVLPSDSPAEDSGPLPLVETSGEMPALQPIMDRPAYHDEADEARRRRSVSSPARMRGWIAFAVIVIAAAVLGAFVWSRTYFVLEREDGVVGINQGFPLSRLSSPYRSSDVTASELSAADRERLVDSHRMLNQEDAERVLDQLAEGLVDEPPVEGSGAADPTNP